MIARLRGEVAEVGENFLVVMVGGVGYRVECSRRVLAELSRAGAEADLRVETFSQEERIRLFGFLDAAEREWFLLLLGVQGIGARVALGLLGAMTPEELAVCLASGDAKGLTRAPGVGGRLARRIVTELKDKVADLSPPAGAVVGGAAAVEGSAEADALQALVNLGYGRGQAQEALRRVRQEAGGDAEMDASDMVRAGLRLLSGQGRAA